MRCSPAAFSLLIPRLHRARAYGKRWVRDGEAASNPGKAKRLYRPLVAEYDIAPVLNYPGLEGCNKKLYGVSPHEGHTTGTIYPNAIKFNPAQHPWDSSLQNKN